MITVIEDPVVPLAAVPGGDGMSMGQTVFIIIIVCVMAAAAVFYMQRYFTQCRMLRLRIVELESAPHKWGATYKSVRKELYEHRFDRSFLREEIRRIEAKKAAEVAEGIRARLSVSDISGR